MTAYRTPRTDEVQALHMRLGYGAVDRRSVAILEEQARALVADVAPWVDDPAAILTPELRHAYDVAVRYLAWAQAFPAGAGRPRYGHDSREDER